MKKNTIENTIYNLATFNSDTVLLSPYACLKLQNQMFEDFSMNV